MFKIKIVSTGKSKENWLISALAEYEKRLSKDFIISWHLYKNDQKMLEAIDKLKAFVCLDPEGKAFTSEEFSTFLFRELENSHDINFIIGGDMGLSKAVLDMASSCLSLSSMTFTHQMTRLILLEQIYRADQIRTGSKYHK